MPINSIKNVENIPHGVCNKAFIVKKYVYTRLCNQEFG